MSDVQARRAAARAGYIAGLRALADLLEGWPEIPTPYDGHASGTGARSHPLTILTGTAELADSLASLYGRPATAEFTDISPDRPSVRLCWHIEGLALQIYVAAPKICQSTVAGVYQVGETTHEVIRWTLPAHLDPAHRDGQGQEAAS